MKAQFIITVFVIIIAACTGTSPIQKQNEVVIQFIEEYYSTMSSRDWENYKNYFIEDAVLTTLWKTEHSDTLQIVTNTIDEFISKTKDGPDSQPLFKEYPVEIEVQQKNGLANVWVLYKAEFGDENNLIKWQGYDLFSLIYHQERWFVVSITYKAIK